MTFTTKRIREITKTLIDYRGKTPTKTLAGIKLITAKVIKNGFIEDGNHEYIAPDDYDKWMRRGLPEKWDILITTEAPLGEVAQLRTTEKVALAQRVILLRGDCSFIDQGYYFHALKSPFVQAGLKARSSGTTVLGIKQSELWNVEIPYPPLEVQKRIASVLSAYDDLIENNTRRIKILERMAQMLYREWFVNFRFPGYQTAQWHKSKLGRIPMDWQIAPLEDVCLSVADGDWIESKDQGGTDYRLLQVSNVGLNEFVETGKFRFITRETYERLHCHEVMPGELLVSRMPKPTGRTWLVRRLSWPIITAVDVAIIAADPAKVHRLFLTYALNSAEQLSHVEKRTTGTTRPRISRRDLCSLPLIVPPLSIQERFASHLQAAHELGECLRAKNAALRKTRDLLLPELMTGKVSIDQIDAEALAKTV